MRLLLLLCTTLLFSADSKRLDTLYNSLDPQSISKHFAYYKLHNSETALHKAWDLLNAHREKPLPYPKQLALPELELSGLISIVNKQSWQPDVTLSLDQLILIEQLASHLHNRKLIGYDIWTKEELLTLPNEEVDIARALLLYEFDDRRSIRQYEASLDLMALQILARLPKGATLEEKVEATNRFIFHEMGFRFPPHSLYAKDIDTYTFLPSVLDSRQGVCLGVSIIYLAIAQRIDLPLEIITPPGHIYVRLHDRLNIETTARGIHLPSETYLGINTRSLQERTMKEVIGLAFINQAAVLWRNEDHKGAIKLYEEAQKFVPHDPLLKMFLGYQYLFVGQKQKGYALLKEMADAPFDYAVAKEATPEDLLKGRVDPDAVKVIYTEVDETRASIIQKQEKLKAIVKKYPKFRDGHFHLAITYLQLGRGAEALEALSAYHHIDTHNPTVEYYLSILNVERYNYVASWNHLMRAESLTSKRNHHPKSLIGLRHTLRTLYPIANLHAK